MTQFIAIRKDDLEKIDIPGISSTVRMCAAGLLNYFRNCSGWVSKSISELREVLFNQFGKDAIAHAREVLHQLGLIELDHHKRNGRMWVYRFKSVKATVIEKRTTVVEEPPMVADEPTTDDGETTTSLYKDPFLDQQQDLEPAVDSEVGISEEEFNQACQEIREIRCTPSIDLNEAVRKEVRANWQNLSGAIAYLKHCLKTWDGRRQYNWTGVLIKALREDQTSPDFCRGETKNSIPTPPDGLEDWVIENLEIVKDFFYSSVRGCWMVVYRNGRQQPAVEAMGGEP